MRRLQLVLVAAAIGSALTAAAISIPAWAGGDDEDPESGEVLAPRDERIREFEACMKEHGFDFGDEIVVRVTPDGVTVNGKQVDAEALREAQRECGFPFPALRLPDFDPGELPRAVPDDLREQLDRLRSCFEEEMD